MLLVKLYGAALLAVLMIGCGIGESATTATTAVSETTTSTTTMSPPQTTSTSAPSTTTTASPSTTGDTGGNSGDIPQECIDALNAYTIDIEEVVAGYDFENAGLREFEAMTIGLVPAASALVETLQGSGCLELNGPFSTGVYPALIDFAKKEAPGAVTYLEVQQAIAGMPLGGSCSDDIDALQAYVDGGAR
jgi:hypothetical protein